MNVTCPQCGTSNELADSFAGQQISCSRCGTLVNTSTAAESVEAVAVEAVPVEATPVEATPVEAVPVEAIAAPVEAIAVPVSADAIASQAAQLSIPKASTAVVEDEEPAENLFGEKKVRDEDELDMTPMVDVTFLLLIFFMVTASFALQKSIEMPIEQSDAPSTNTVEEEEEDTDLVTVQIDEFNSFMVIAAEFEREVPGKQNLIRALREAKPDSDACRLKVEVHENSVIEAVIDVMDAGAGVGFSEIQKSEVKSFD